MIKKSLLLTLLLALFVPWAANAYNHQVQVGDGTSGQNIAPINLYYNYSYSQQIYTADQINAECVYVGDIESISFYYAGSVAKTVPITVFMKTTEKTSFATTSDWETVTEDDIVFNGDLEIPSTAGWVTITLNAPFAYDGESNLLIAIDKGYYDNYTNQSWRYTAVTNNQVIQYRSDSTDPNPYSPTTASDTSKNLPNIMFNMMIAHPAPSALTLDEVVINTATISWTAPTTTNTITGYAYEYTDGETIETGTSTGTTANLTGLTAATDYLFEVKAIYSDGESCWSEALDFTTMEACMTPENLTISDVTAHAATLTWTEGYGDGQWVLQYKLSTEEEYTNSLEVALAELPYTLTGLTAESTYNVQIAPVCDATKTITGNFTTAVACFAPTNLAVEANAQTATFTWESDVNDYEIAHASVATADPIDNIVGTATDTVYSMSNLTIDTDHYFWVRSNCGSEGYSAWAGPVSVHIGYCVPNPSSHDGKGITGVSFGTGDYVVTNGDGSASLPASAPYYGDYSSMIGAVQAGVESTIAITTGTNSYPYTFVIWVDFDNSLSFEDSEVVYIGKASSGNGTLNATITIPVTQELGDYRMRIYGADSYFTNFYNSGNTNWEAAHDPCSSGSYRHAHDYTLRVLEAPSCLAPTGLTVSDVTAHNATISWTSDAEAWEIQLDEEEAIEVTETTYTFTGLTAETTYSVKVRTNCGGTYSDWTNPVSFTTGIACPAPTVAVSNVTAFTAEVSCTNTDAEYFNVMLDTVVVAENVTMPYTLTDLTANTSYTVKVKALCGGEDGESAWSNGTTFTTLEICPDGKVCIGQGTNTNSYVPTYSYYKYSLTEQIYTAEEIGGAGLIESVDFYCSGSITRNLNVYMVSTEKDVFESTTDWIAVTPDNLVFSGSFTTTANDWTTITFETPFLYDGTTNVAIIVDDNTGSYVSSPNFYVFNAQGYQTLRVYSDGTNYDPEAPSQYTGTQMNVKNRVRIAIGEPPACPKPTGLAVNYTGGITAEVTWEGEAETYNIDVNGEVTEGVTSPYVLDSLEVATTYAVKVQANCGEDLSDWTNPVSFTTDLCMPENMCEITIELTDSYGDGWNGGQLSVVDALTEEVLGTFTLPSSTSSGTYTLAVCDGRAINIVYASGSYPTENGWVITDINGEVISEHEGCNSGCAPTDGIQATYTVDCTLDPCAVPGSLAASEVSAFGANLSWTGNNDDYNLRYRHPVSDDPTAFATIILTAGDIWGDGSGYQMLLDADATAYGTIIPEIGSSYGYISTDGTIGGTPGDVSSSVYDEFEYKVPENADGSLSTENIVVNNSISIEIPAGTYDWCITNPTTGDRMWIAASNGNVGGRYNDFVFEAGLTYEFTISNYGINDGVDVTITPMSDWTLVEDITSPYNFTGLTPHTLYEWQVQGISTECEGGVTEWSASSTFITNKGYYWDEEATWGGEIPGEYNDVTTPDNIDVIIRANTIVEAGCVFIGNGGSLTMEPGAQFYHINDVPVSVQLNVVGYENGSKNDGGYYLLSVPVFTNDIDSTILVEDTHLNTGEFDLYFFDQNYSREEWRNFKAGMFNALTLGQGYLYANEDNIFVSFVGNTVSTETTRSRALVYNSTVELPGWNLVGNPFTCIAYADKPFYTMNGDGDEIIYSTSNTIQVMEGIFVEATAEGQSVTFSPAHPDGKSALNINLSQGLGIVDCASIRFDEGDMLLKFQLNPNHTKVYIPMDGEDYAVVSAEEMGEMPVSFKAETNGTYNMSFMSEEVSFNYLHLIDNMTGADVDLLVNPSYTFDAQTTDYASRFKLVFATGSNSDDNFAFYSNGSFVVSNEGNATLQVIDITGRILNNETINGSANVHVDAAPGVYMLRLINGDNVKVQKVVVR